VPSTVLVERAGKIYTLTGVLLCLGGMSFISVGASSKGDIECGLIVMAICVVIIGTWLGLLGRRLRQLKIEDPNWVPVVTFLFGLMATGILGIFAFLQSKAISPRFPSEWILTGIPILSMGLLICAAALVTEGRMPYLEWRKSHRKTIVRRNPFDEPRT